MVLNIRKLSEWQGAISSWFDRDQSKLDIWQINAVLGWLTVPHVSYVVRPQ